MLDKYNAFEHLCASVFPIGARERIVTMLTVYADESGTDGRSPLVAVGGYISTKDKWDSFQEKWDDFCSKNDIGIFHATDLIAQRGEFSGWTKKRAESAFRIADNLISEHVLYGAVGYTTIAACEKVFPLKHPERGKRRKFSMEYFQAGLMVANLITVWAEKNNFTEPINFVFEDGAEGRGHLHDALTYIRKSDKPRAHLVGPISFADKKLIHQLHAADRFVNYATRSINNFNRDERTLDNRRVKDLVKLKLGEVHSMTERNFPILAQRMDIEVEGLIYEKEN